MAKPQKSRLTPGFTMETWRIKGKRIRMEVLRDVLGRFVSHKKAPLKIKEYHIKKAYVGIEGKLGDALARSNILSEKVKKLRIEITMRGLDSRGRKIRKRLTIKVEKKRHHTHFASMFISRINEELFYDKGLRLSYPASIFKVKQWSRRKVSAIMTRAKWNKLEQVRKVSLTMRVIAE